MISDLLQTEEYSLCLSPGFFRFYALMGVVEALDQNHCLNVKAVSGSSAGALVGGFLASGMSIAEMPERVFSIKRADMWDMGIGCGLLKGGLFQRILEEHLPVATFEQCTIPVGMTAYDVFGMRTNCIQSGDLATAIRASCTFPGLFQPVMIDGRPHIDGGGFDDCGLMALPCVPPSNLIVNVVCGRGRLSSSKLPDRYKDARLLTLVMDNIPMVSPFTMETDGPTAYALAKAATYRLLRGAHLQQLSPNHWLAFIDGGAVDVSMRLIPLPRPTRARSASTGFHRPYRFNSQQALCDEQGGDDAGTAGTGGADANTSTSTSSRKKRKSTGTATTTVTTTGADTATAAAAGPDTATGAGQQSGNKMPRRSSTPTRSEQQRPAPSTSTSTSTSFGANSASNSGRNSASNSGNKKKTKPAPASGDKKKKSNNVFTVESVQSHRGDATHPSEMSFLVRWRGFASESDTWEPYDQLAANEALHVYLKKHKLTALIPKKYR